MTKRTSILTAGPNNHQTTSEEANQFATDFIEGGILGVISNTGGLAPMSGGYAIGQNSAMTITVQPGTAYILTTPSGQSAQVLRTIMDATENIVINANATGSTRYDWVYLRHKPTEANAPNTAGTDVAEFVVSRSTSNVTDNGGGATNAELLAVVTVANGAVAITNGNISDRRTRTTLTTGVDSAVTTGWNALTTMPTVSSGYNKGGKEAELTFAGVDLSTTLYPGMRLKCDRSIIAPVQCADFEDTSSQYASKSSPTGIVFTDDITIEARIWLENYDGAIVSRRDAGTANGWSFEVGSQGQLVIIGLNGGSFRLWVSYASLPLGQWIHVTATLDMSAGTCTMYLDGELITAYLTSSGTPSSLVQAGNMQVGGSNGSNLFDGKISDVRVWNVVRTATQIRDNANQQLVGNETNLVAYYKLDGNFNDSTANANNMTAVNGALATTVDNSLKNTEQAIITKVTYSAPNTLVSVYTGTDYNIPNMILANPYYSIDKSPAGFSSSKNKWRHRRLYNGVQRAGIGAFGSWYEVPGTRIVLPTGEWNLRWEGSASQSNSVGGPPDFWVGMNTVGSGAPSIGDLGQHLYENVNVNVFTTPAGKEAPVAVSAQTTYYLVALANSGGGSVLVGYEGGVVNSFTLEAECAYA